MKLVNLTPHSIKILYSDGNLLKEFKSDGLARVKETFEISRSIEVEIEEGYSDSIQSIQTIKVLYGEVEGLPLPQEGTLYIVSHIVRTHRPQRVDLLSPGEVVRNLEGHIIGCRNFIRNGLVSKG